MSLAYQVAKILSILLFLFYGLGCLLSKSMVAEFERFGLARFRRLTGGLEVLGAVGLLCGYMLPALDIAASAGLAILMALGVATRIRVGDSWIERFPAIVLMLVNLFILLFVLQWPSGLFASS